MLEKLINFFQKPSETLPNGQILTHQSYSVEKPENYRPPLVRNVIKQNIINKDDFIAFCNEYKTDATKLFYNNEIVKAIFNYPTKDEADYGDSVACMNLIFTEHFAFLHKNLDENISQPNFIRLLKRLEPFITMFDGEKVQDMDIVEIAEDLQASKNINSIIRNTSQKFVMDVEIGTGRKNIKIPRYITFEMPIFKNDLEAKYGFDVELFFNHEESGFTATLLCYQLEELIDNVARALTYEIREAIDATSYMT